MSIWRLNTRCVGYIINNDLMHHVWSHSSGCQRAEPDDNKVGTAGACEHQTIRRSIKLSYISRIQLGCPLKSDHPKVIIESSSVVVWMHYRLSNGDVLNVVKLGSFSSTQVDFMHPKGDDV